MRWPSFLLWKYLAVESRRRSEYKTYGIARPRSSPKLAKIRKYWKTLTKEDTLKDDTSDNAAEVKGEVSAAADQRSAVQRSVRCMGA